MRNTVKLINLDTGELIETDYYVLMGRGLPDGFVIADEVTVEEYAASIRRALEK